jgi:nucleoside-diphosphate-sugar epimerase
MSRNILVAGGLGFIGSHIASTLANIPGLTVLVYDVQPGECTLKNGCNIRGDIFDFDGLVEVMRDQDVSEIVQMIGLASIPACEKSPDVSFKLNVSSVQNTLEAMRVTDTKHLVFPSTAAVYGMTNGPKLSEFVEPKPTSVYGCHKLVAELLIQEYAENYGFDATILRLFNVYGDLEKEQGVISLFVRKALANEPLIIMGGEQLRDFIHLNDVVEAFVHSLDNGAAYGEIINVGSGVGMTIKEIAEIVKHNFPKVEVKYEPPSKKEYSIYADTSKMRDLLGCNTVDPRQGIPAFVEKCKEKCKETWIKLRLTS